MATLKTDYFIPEIPFPEYPRPQEERKEWLNLNGKWQFAKTKKQEKSTSFGEILVPFSPETANSGIGNGFTLGEGEMLVYQRVFSLKKQPNTATLLHFGAVDSHAEVFVNGKLAGTHDCGYTAFTLDITDFVQDGENQLRVEVTDDFAHGARGKQSKKAGGIWYTAQSGIWQTVWLETLPFNYIRGLRYTMNAENKTVTVYAGSNGVKQTIRVFDGERQIAEKIFTSKTEIAYDFEYWSPENPKLYDVIITNADGDEVKSYFGYRFFTVGKDKTGIPRLFLNGKPYFFSGVLDQGYWPDGLLTPPSDKAMSDELQLLKRMGFNTVRKHIKIEPMRWYYHCDKLGLVVWQDFVNGGGEYKFTHVAAFPFLGFQHKDSDYRYFSRENEQGRAEFEQMAKDTVSQLFNCTSIGMWVIFNEGWGQFDSAYFTEWLKNADPSRVIDSVSGWHDQGKTITTLKSLHTYYTPLRVPKDPRPVVLSEFGGYSFKISGHVFAEDKEFGYKKFRDREKLNLALSELFSKKLKPLIKKGLCASIYTQVSDVEEEINGLVTYDRKIVKVNANMLNALNQALYKEMDEQ